MYRYKKYVITFCAFCGSKCFYNKDFTMVSHEVSQRLIREMESTISEAGAQTSTRGTSYGASQIYHAGAADKASVSVYESQGAQLASESKPKGRRASGHTGGVARLGGKEAKSGAKETATFTFRESRTTKLDRSHDDEKAKMKHHDKVETDQQSPTRVQHRVEQKTTQIETQHKQASSRSTKSLDVGGQDNARINVYESQATYMSPDSKQSGKSSASGYSGPGSRHVVKDAKFGAKETTTTTTTSLTQKEFQSSKPDHSKDSEEEKAKRLEEREEIDKQSPTRGTRRSEQRTMQTEIHHKQMTSGRSTAKPLDADGLGNARVNIYESQATRVVPEQKRRSSKQSGMISTHGVEDAKTGTKRTISTSLTQKEFQSSKSDHSKDSEEEKAKRREEGEEVDKQSPTTDGKQQESGAAEGKHKSVTTKSGSSDVGRRGQARVNIHESQTNQVVSDSKQKGRASSGKQSGARSMQGLSKEAKSGAKETAIFNYKESQSLTTSPGSRADMSTKHELEERDEAKRVEEREKAKEREEALRREEREGAEKRKESRRVEQETMLTEVQQKVASTRHDARAANVEEKRLRAKRSAEQQAMMQQSTQINISDAGSRGASNVVSTATSTSPQTMVSPGGTRRRKAKYRYTTTTTTLTAERQRQEERRQREAAEAAEVADEERKKKRKSGLKEETSTTSGQSGASQQTAGQVSNSVSVNMTASKSGPHGPKPTYDDYEKKKKKDY